MILVSLDYLYENEDGFYSLSNEPKGKYSYSFDVAVNTGPIASIDANYEIIVSANNERKAVKKLSESIDDGLFAKIENMTETEHQQAKRFYG